MTDITPLFPALADHDALEMGRTLAPRFGADGLVTAVVVDVRTRDVVMLAHMNAEALARTIETGVATYWSRSRKALWVKGETSGHVQKLVEMRVDCDRDTLLVLIEQTGPACHTNRRSCFFTALRDGAEVEILRPLEAD